MHEIGESLISVLVVGRDGLVIDILTKDSEKPEEKKFIGAFSSLSELVLKKITQDFDLGTFGAGTFDTDKYRFIFCESGFEYILVTILDAIAHVDDVFPYTYMTAEKVAHIMDGDPDISPVIPKIKRETEIEKLKHKMDYFQKKRAYPSDYIYKLSLIGDGGVGKTSMVQMYINGIFHEDYKATIGTFITKKECKFEELNTSVRFIIWDLAGQEQFKRIWPDYLTDSTAGIIVFDITDRKSFENVKNWYDIITRVALPNLILILAGNKVDLDPSRVVSTEEGQELAKELGIYYIETSAKTNKSIDNVFEWVALQLINLNVAKNEIAMVNDQIKTSLKYIISRPQLKFLQQYFIKQLDYIISNEETQKCLRVLDILKTIEKNQLP